MYFDLSCIAYHMLLYLDRLLRSHHVLCCILYGMYFAYYVILLWHVIVVIYWDIMVCGIVMQFRIVFLYCMLSYNILYRLRWVSYDIIMAWLHTIWFRDLCSYRDSIWRYGIVFHITWYYYCISLVIIPKFCHIIWYCNLGMYLYIALYYVAYYMGSYGIFYDVIMAYHWSSVWLMAHHVIIQCTDLLIINIIL